MKRKIIDKIVRQAINESLTSKIYHFTSLQNLLQILLYDKVKLQSSISTTSDGRIGNSLYYMCFTRVKDGRQGFSRGLNVRIGFNGDLLNRQYKGSPVDYWGETMGKTAYMNRTANDGSNDGKIPYFQNRTENEERLYSSKAVLPNVSRYITGIDVCAAGDDTILPAIVELATRLRIDIRIYTDRHDFDVANGKNLMDNKELLSRRYDGYTVNTQQAGDDMFRFKGHNTMSGLITVFSLLCIADYTPEEKVPAIVGETLKKYGLGQYARVVIPRVLQDVRAGGHIFQPLMNDFRSLQTKLNPDMYGIVHDILSNGLHRLGVHSLGELVRYMKVKHKQLLAKYDSFKYVNYDKEVPLWTVMDDEQDLRWRYVLVDPGNTVWEDISRYPVSEIVRNIDDYLYEGGLINHGSRNNEYFMKYVEYIFTRKPQMTNIIKIMRLFPAEKQFEIFGCAVEKLNVRYYMNDYRLSFINDEDRKRFKELFIDYDMD